MAGADRKSTLIGRSSKLVDVVLDVAPIKSISRKHAEVVVRTDGGGQSTFVLRDLVSATNLPCFLFVMWPKASSVCFSRCFPSSVEQVCQDSLNDLKKSGVLMDSI